MATFKRNEPRRMWRPFQPPPPAVPSTRDRRVRVRAGLARPAFADDDRAGCKQPGTDPAWWYAPEEEPGQPKTSGRDAARAIAICNRCPLEADCRSYALAAGETWGIWGGQAMGDQRHGTRRRRSA
jgi:hypothetical protein